MKMKEAIIDGITYPAVDLPDGDCFRRPDGISRRVAEAYDNADKETP